MKALAAAVPAALLLLVIATAAAWPGHDRASQPRDGTLGLWGGLEGLPRGGGTLTIDGAIRSYSPEEVLQLRAFVESGGRLVVVEPTAPAASLLLALDVGITAPRGAAFDPDVDAQGRFLAVPAPGFGELSSAARASDPMRLAASQVIAGDAASVFDTGPFVWHDVDADGEPGIDDPRGTWSLARVAEVGDGAVLVVGARALLDDPGIAAWTTRQQPHLDDTLHRNGPDALGAGELLAGHRPAAIAGLLGAVAVVGALVAWGVQVRRVAAKRRRGPVDRQTLELLAELAG